MLVLLFCAFLKLFWPLPETGARACSTFHLGWHSKSNVPFSAGMKEGKKPQFVLFSVTGTKIPSCQRELISIPGKAEMTAAKNICKGLFEAHPAFLKCQRERQWLAGAGWVCILALPTETLMHTVLCVTWESPASTSPCFREKYCKLLCVTDNTKPSVAWSHSCIFTPSLNPPIS